MDRLTIALTVGRLIWREACKEKKTSKQFEVIVDFAPGSAEEEQWEAWTKQNEISGLERDDIMVDTGRGTFEGKTCDVRRYRVRKDKLDKIYAEK